jgi:hypothetical protein
MRFRHFLPILASALFLIAGCSGGDDKKSDTISGVVILDGQTDYSNVEVSAYAIPAENAYVSQAHSEHASIGAQGLSGFDHRTGSVLKSVTTSSNGSFSISGLSATKCVIVISKTGFGCRYYTDCIPGQSLPATTLYQETTLGDQIYTAPFTFQTNHHYIISLDTHFQSPATVTVEPGTWIRIAKNRTLDIECPISFSAGSDEPFRITSNELFDDTAGAIDASDIRSFSSFSIDFTATSTSTIRNGIVSFGAQALTAKAPTVEVSNCLFHHCSSGLVGNSQGTLYVDHASFVEMISSNSSGVEIQNCTAGEVTYCLFASCYFGVHAVPHWNGSISNCWFQGGAVGVCFEQVQGSIKNSEFYDNSTADIVITRNNEQGEPGMVIEKNILKSATAIMGQLLTSWDYFTSLDIDYNNFYNSEFYFNQTFRSFLSDCLFNAHQNYWNGEISEELVRAKIYSSDDFPDDPINYPTFYIDGMLSNPNNDAGIQ